jgi:hypothetical protein
MDQVQRAVPAALLIEPARSQGISAADFDRAATRVLASILAAREPGLAFASRIEAGIGAALERFDREPRLAVALLSAAAPDLGLSERRASWGQTYAELLREAAAEAPEARAAPIALELHLVDALCWRLRRRLADPQCPDFGSELPAALELILSYYLDPAQVAPIVAASRASVAGIPVHRRRVGGSLGPL